MKRLTIIALIVLLIAGLFVACDQDKIVDDEFNQAIDITNETRSLVPGNTYRTVADTTIKDRVIVEGEGTVTILLSEGKTLTTEKGINVTEKQELHIEGTGKLVATGDPKSAGIGGGDGENGGTIVIQGGEITANGGSEGGAGIGGGKGGKGGTTIIQKLDGKDVPEVTTKGGTAGSDGIGNGEGATGDPEDIELDDGVGLESSDDELTWYDFDDEPHYRKQYMRTFEGVTISFNANGGTGDMPDQVAHVNKDKRLNANAFTNGEMNFVGWNTKADGTGTAYGNKGTINTDKDVTLFAQWADAIPIDETTTTLEGGNKYTITEDVDNYNRLTITDDGDKTVTIYLPAGTKLTLRKGINVEQGKTLIIEGAGTLDATGDTNCAGIGGDDRTLTRDCGTIIIKGGTVQATGSTYAAGIGGGGGGAGGTVSILGGTVIATGSSTGSTPGIGNGFGASNKGTLTLGTGMSLTGDDTTGDTFITGPVDEDTPYEGERFKIMKTIPSVTVTFDKNDSAASGEMTPQMVTYNVEQSLKENKYTHPTLNFTGWNTKSDGTGTAIADKGKIKITEDTTLYAQWEVAPTGNYITSTTTSIQSGKTWTIAANVVNENKITIDGTEETTIILPEGLKLEVKNGIAVSSGQTLIIDGTGELVAGEALKGVAEGQAGIGSYDRYDLGGTIIINGGTITAYGGDSTSGIGSKNYTSLSPQPTTGTLNIIINGGDINSTGGEGSGAGIGGFRANIQIKGDDTIIHAQGTDGWSGAGIGGYGCTIDISGGTIYATGKGQSAGIGSNGVFDEFDSDQKITISGGTIEATGGTSSSYGAGAGIGGGADCDGGKITISGDANVTAVGGGGDEGSAAGIGGGHNGDGGTILISGGTVVATGGTGAGGNGAAGIGGGGEYYGGTDGGEITISGTASITATGGENAAGIGGGYTGTQGTITLNDGIALFMSDDNVSWSLYTDTPKKYMKTGTVQWDYINSSTTALEDGKTYTLNANSVTNNNRITISGSVTIVLPKNSTLTLSKGITVAEGQTLTISGYSSGKLYATGIERAAGIGGVDKANGGSIIINGGQITATGGAGGAGIGGGRMSSCDVTINGGKVEATGGARYYDGISTYYCGGAGIGSGQGASTITVNITGGVVTAKGTDAGTGIGGAANWASTNTTIAITISGGEITASAGANASINGIDFAAAGIGGSFGQPISDSGTGSMTITLLGSPKIKASAGVNTGVEAYRYAWGIGRGNKNNSSIEEANLDLTGLAAGVKLQVSATDTDDYVDFNGSNRMRYMKTDNYEEPEP